MVGYPKKMLTAPSGWPNEAKIYARSITRPSGDKTVHHNPTAANRITKAILDGCAQLKQFPEMGVSIGAKTSYETDLRMLVVESYIALYRIETEVVSVGRIINARQDYIRILFGEVSPQ